MNLEKNIALETLTIQELRLCEYVLKQLISEKNRNVGEVTTNLTEINVDITLIVNEVFKYPDIIFGIRLLGQIINTKENKSKGVKEPYTDTRVEIGKDHNVLVKGNISKLEEIYSKVQSDLKKKEGYSQQLSTKSDDIKKVEGRNNLFVFNRITGDFKLNKVESYFPANEQKFNLVNTFFDHKFLYASYEQIAVKVFKKEKTRVDLDNSAVKDSTRQILDKIKRDMKILPKKEAENDDIFESRNNAGYIIKVK